MPTLRTLPVSTEATPSFSPTWRMSTCLPLKEKQEVREATCNPGTLERAPMISSVIPSLKYSFSGSALMLARGSTAMALAAGALLGASGGVRWAAPFGRSTSAKWAAVGKRSTAARASARVTTSSSPSGTSRIALTWGTGETNRLVMTACAVGPVNGTSPVSIS